VAFDSARDESIEALPAQAEGHGPYINQTTHTLPPSIPSPRYQYSPRHLTSSLPASCFTIDRIMSGIATVEINDAIFCQSHLKEVCNTCPYDGREENDSFYGFDPIDREGIDAPASSQTKDGDWQCKKHGSTTCNQCYGWKKQITRLRAAAKKAGKKSS